ncbi:wffP domain protein [Escherichia coli 8-415-05_S1_C2]|nr:wffP domain protein [Escherichia coli 8-415-05_S1_C2]
MIVEKILTIDLKFLIINFLTLSLNAQVINSTQLLQNQYMEGA